MYNITLETAIVFKTMTLPSISRFLILQNLRTFSMLLMFLAKFFVCNLLQENLLSTHSTVENAAQVRENLKLCGLCICVVNIN